MNQIDVIIDCYAACPANLQAILDELPESDLDLTENGQGWSIRQYVHHVVDGDEIWKTFIKRAIGNPQGVFELIWYWQVPQEEWARAWAYADRDITPSLDLFSASRAQIAQLLRAVPGALEKRLNVCWPDGSQQVICVQDVVEMQTRHVDGHIADIKRILSAHQE